MPSVPLCSRVFGAKPPKLWLRMSVEFGNYKEMFIFGFWLSCPKTISITFRGDVY